LTVLAVDVGRTAFRAAIFSEGSRGGSVTLDNGATLSDADGVGKLRSLLDTATRVLVDGDTSDLDSVVIGSAGAFFRPDAAKALLDAVADEYPDVREIVVTTDIVIAHSGALNGQSGVVISAGTGAVAFAVAGSGATTLVDGCGYLVGDAGSGFTVGRAGLAAALRHRDQRRGGSAVLAQLAAEQYGPLAELPGRLHADSGPARAVAAFAPAVAAAARDGDPIAVGIWQNAVSELADTAVAACDALPVDDQRIAVIGSLFDLTDLVADPFTVTMTARKPGVPVRRATGDALAGAALMAGAPADRYANLVLRSVR
jgi:glucosamine kinase